MKLPEDPNLKGFIGSKPNFMSSGSGTPKGTPKGTPRGDPKGTPFATAADEGHLAPAEEGHSPGSETGRSSREYCTLILPITNMCQC